jgi:hypothetical protein
VIEKTVLRWLETKLSVPAYLAMPEKPPPRFAFLEKIGSGRSNHVNRATFAVQSYGENLLDAMNLNEEVKDAMDSLTELSEVTASRLNSDYPFHDEERKRYRYQAVYDLTHY